MMQLNFLASRVFIKHLLFQTLHLNFLLFSIDKGGGGSYTFWEKGNTLKEKNGEMILLGIFFALQLFLLHRIIFLANLELKFYLHYQSSYYAT